MDKHQASWLDTFYDNVERMHEDYIRPQENGSHWNCEYVKLTDRNGDGIFAFAPFPFSFNVSRYTQEELTCKAVSYTHLDVYKRQIQCSVVDAGKRGDAVFYHLVQIQIKCKDAKLGQIHIPNLSLIHI